MTKKKRVKKAAAKRASSSKFNLHFNFLDSKDRIKLVLNQLLFFVAMSLVSLVLYRLVHNVILLNLSSAMVGIFGFVAVGFLIALLVLLIKKAIKK